MPHLGTQRGFTVFELLVVIGVMGILAAVAVPNLRQFSDETALLSVQREAMSALYIARSSAIANNAVRQVIFTPPQLIEIKDQAGTTTYYRRSLARYGSTITIGGSTATTVAYDARGLLSPPATVSLTVSNSIPQTRTITVYATGRPALS